MKTCPVCQREFKPARKETVYCSRNCANKSQIVCDYSPKICKQCGKEFINPDPRQGTYCSISCRSAAQKKPIGAEYIRQCTACHNPYPATSEYFGNDRGRLTSECRICLRKRKAKDRQDNPEKFKEQSKRDYEKHKKARNAASQHYYEENREKVRAYKNGWQKANIESVRESNRIYREKTREKKARWSKNNAARLVVYKQRRKALKRSLPSTFTDTDWLTSLDYWKYVCVYCGRPIGFWHTLAQDHFIPLSKGGAYTPDNILPACHGIDGCNNSNADRDAEEWLIEKFGKRKAVKILKKIRVYFEWIHTAVSSGSGSSSE